MQNTTKQTLIVSLYFYGLLVKVLTDLLCIKLKVSCSYCVSYDGWVFISGVFGDLKKRIMRAVASQGGVFEFQRKTYMIYEDRFNRWAVHMSHGTTLMRLRSSVGEMNDSSIGFVTQLRSIATK